MRNTFINLHQALSCRIYAEAFIESTSAGYCAGRSSLMPERIPSNNTILFNVAGITFNTSFIQCKADQKFFFFFCVNIYMVSSWIFSSILPFLLLFIIFRPTFASHLLVFYTNMSNSSNVIEPAMANQTICDEHSIIYIYLYIIILSYGDK